MLRTIPRSDSILAAVSRIESLEAVSLYTVSLAKRTSMEASLLLVLEGDGSGDGISPSTQEGILRAVRESGEAEGVTIRCGIVHGRFTDEVAERLRTMDSPILVVGVGKNRRSRLQELNRIEKKLKEDRTWSRRNTHHFLVVARRRETKARGRVKGNGRSGTTGEGEVEDSS